MFRMTHSLAFLAFAGIAFAQTVATAHEPFLKMLHDREDQSWARKSGLDATDVHEMRLAVGISDTSSSSIANIDANSLGRNKHILLVEALGQCVRLHVLERTVSEFKEVWSSSGITTNETPGRETVLSREIETGRRQGFCSQAPRAASAHATADGRIVVEVPILFDLWEKTIPVYTYSFAWDGSKYVLLVS